MRMREVWFRDWRSSRVAYDEFTVRTGEDIYSWVSGHGYLSRSKSERSIWRLKSPVNLLSNFALLGKKSLITERICYTDTVSRLRLNPKGNKVSIDARETARFEEPAILIGGSSNHHHWLTNWLPRILLVDEAKVEGFSNCKLVVHGDITETQREMLDWLGVDRGRVLPLDLESETELLTARFDHLLVPEYFQTSEYSSWSIGKLAALLAAMAPTKSKRHFPKRFLISRRDISGPLISRDIENEDDLVEMLKGFGIERVSLSGMSLADQIELFRGAELVIGAHGAGLTNLMFCKPGTQYIVLQNQDWSPTYLVYGHIFQLKASKFIGKSVDQSDTGLHPRDFAFSVDEKRLSAHLSSTLSDYPISLTSSRPQIN